MTVEFKPLPFEEAIRFFEDKIVLLPEQYKKLIAEAKAKAFSVSGVAKMDILDDLFSSLDKSLTEGVSYGEWKKSIKDIMQKRGWDGLAPYRLENIFRTNVQTAYQAGHYARQMDAAGDKPYWQYVAVMDSRTRPSHASMNGKVLLYDHPWWKQNYPPNGFACRCTVIALSRVEMERDNLKDMKKAPDIFDKGWGHNPGAAMGERVPEGMFEKLQSSPDRWTPLITKGYADYGLMPAKEITDYAPSGKALWPRGQRAVDLYLENMNGKVLTDAVNDPLIMNRQFIDHLKLDGRERFMPLIEDIALKPHEIWFQAEKEKLTGKIVSRKRYIAFIEAEKGRPLILVADATKGQWLGYTIVYTDKLNTIDNARQGVLLYGGK